MQKYILERVVQALLSLLVVSIIVFLLARASGSPVDLYLGDLATAEDRLRLEQEFGLDKPLWVQYQLFIQNAVRGDFGQSIKTQRPAILSVVERAPATMQLGLVAIAMSIIIALPIGVLSAVRRGSRLDSWARGFAILGQATPSFWLALVLMLVFAVWLGWLPSAGIGTWKHLVLPSVAMGWYVSAGLMRITRSSMLDVLDTEYIKLLRAKGLPEWKVIWVHALKNAAIPILTFSAILFVIMLAGSIIIETIFAWPGVGQLAIQSVQWRDYTVVQTVVIFLSAAYILANLLVDVMYAYLNPRIRY